MTTTITLGTHTISELVKNLEDHLDPIKSTWIAFEDESVFEKARYYGTTRRWNLQIVEKVTNYNNSLHKYLKDLTGTGNKVSFNYSGDNYSVSTTVTVDIIDFSLNAESKNPIHRFTVKLREDQG